jgi:hypothetical protein
MYTLRRQGREVPICVGAPAAKAHCGADMSETSVGPMQAKGQNWRRGFNSAKDDQEPDDDINAAAENPQSRRTLSAAGAVNQHRASSPNSEYLVGRPPVAAPTAAF